MNLRASAHPQAMETTVITAPDPAEKKFYLRSFRNRCLTIQVPDAATVKVVAPLLEELRANETMVLLLAPAVSASLRPLRLTRRDLAGGPARLAALSARLLEDGIAYVRRPASLRAPAVFAFSRELALALGSAKIVVVDERGALRNRGGRRSFVNARALARVVGAGTSCGGWSSGELQEMLLAVRSGIDFINLTAAAGLAAELYSYEGSGTLITAQDYCKVEKLRIDQFHEARRLLLRGESQGFLLPRSEEQRARLLLCGYGAWFGDRRVAGVAALETESYRSQRLGEIAGLYTITRFKGEGVGVGIIKKLEEVARAAKLRALFACTSNDRAAAFFLRQGFEQVKSARVPASKRRSWPAGHRAAVFWRDL